LGLSDGILLILVVQLLVPEQKCQEPMCTTTLTMKVIPTMIVLSVVVAGSVLQFGKLLVLMALLNLRLLAARIQYEANPLQQSSQPEAGLGYQMECGKQLELQGRLLDPHLEEQHQVQVVTLLFGLNLVRRLMKMVNLSRRKDDLSGGENG